jgi:hypothetical protein
MNVNAALGSVTSPLKRLDLGGLHKHRGWLVLVLTVVAIVLAAFVRSWAECRYFYQAEWAYYQAHPAHSGFQPQQASLPVLTVWIRIGGQLLRTAAAWMAWTAGLYLIGQLLGQREARLGTTLKLVAWSWLPFAVRALAQSLYMGLAQDPIFNPGLSGLVWDNTPPPPGGGYRYVMPTRSQELWAAVLSHVDLYLFGHLALVVRGLRSETGYPPKKALAMTAIVALVLGALCLAPTMFGNNFRQLRLF